MTTGFQSCHPEPRGRRGISQLQSKRPVENNGQIAIVRSFTARCRFRMTQEGTSIIPKLFARP